MRVCPHFIAAEAPDRTICLREIWYLEQYLDNGNHATTGDRRGQDIVVRKPAPFARSVYDMVLRNYGLHAKGVLVSSPS